MPQNDPNRDQGAFCVCFIYTDITSVDNWRLVEQLWLWEERNELSLPPYCPAWGLERETKVFTLLEYFSKMALQIRPPGSKDTVLLSAF